MTPGGLRPFFSYYGSKFRLAPHYPPPRYGVIYETFAGSAGYSLAYPDHQIHLIDKDPTIAGLWDYLIHVSPEEILRLPDHVEHVDDIKGPQEARWLVGFWLNAATVAPSKTPSAWVRQAQAGDVEGLAGGYNLAKASPGRDRVSYTPKAARDRFWGPAKRALIASQVERIRHWTITHGSYADAPDVEATWHIDPPYKLMGTYYKMGAKQIDFPHLAGFCRSRRGQVMVCENVGATWLPFRQFRRMYGARKQSVEAIWTQDSALHRFALRGDRRPTPPGPRIITSLR